MSYSDACMRTMVENGVLLKDGNPAGMDLISKSEVRISIVDGDFERQDALKMFDSLWDEGDASHNRLFFREYIEDQINSNQGATFNEEQLGKIKEGIQYWYDGDTEIRFVGLNELPDITIFSVNKGGIALPPVNGNEELSHAENSYPILLLPIEEGVMKYPNLATHEFGHALGVLHPFDVVKEINSENITHFCTMAEIDLLSKDSSDKGHMSYGFNGVVSGFDIGVKEFIRTGLTANAPEF